MKTNISVKKSVMFLQIWNNVLLYQRIVVLFFRVLVWSSTSSAACFCQISCINAMLGVCMYGNFRLYAERIFGGSVILARLIL